MAGETTDTQGMGRRHRAASGVIVNGAFNVGLGTLNTLRFVIAAGFLTAAQFGIWGIVYVFMRTVIALKQVGIGDKYIQQREQDQELAFQRAFTLELMSAGIFVLGSAVTLPVVVLAYGRPELLAPGLTIVLILPALALQSPVWVFYRRMDYLRQRLLLAADPVTAFAVTIVLAALGLGYWSLVIGMVAGAWVAALVALVAAPYRLAFRFERAAMREYLAFSWPLLLTVLSGPIVAQLSLYVGELTLGLAAAGAITLASTFSQYADRVDRMVTETLYPAICAVRDRKELLFEAFVKSNRLALMWGVPAGVGLTLFAADLVHFAIGEQWLDAIVLIEVFGLTAAAGHIGFNWTAFYRALGNTRPIAVVSVVGFLAFCLVALPLLALFGLEGFAAGTAIMTGVILVARWRYLARLFPGLQIALYMLRAIAPTIPAVVAVLGLRLAVSTGRTPELALAELATYLAVTAVATWFLERPLLVEAVGYLRRPRMPAPQA